VISDGNDTSSSIDVATLQGLIRESEVLVYAIGIDAQAGTDSVWPGRQDNMLASVGQWLQRTRPRPMPFPIPGRRGPARPLPLPPSGPVLPPPRYPTPAPAPRNPTTSRNLSSDRVNVAALRDITDDSGGRTEIVRTAYDLDPATAGIADELSKQYYLGYPATGVKDGRWHTIRVEVTRAQYRVRARRGFMATP
jgi:VWFA-related protein